MSNISLKTIIKAVFMLALVGLVVWGMMALNQIASQKEVAAEKWVPDALTEEESRWDVVAENEQLKLSFDPAETTLLVEDKLHGTQWRSNPENAAKDSVAFGQNKSLIRSLLDITYVDNQSASYTVNSYMGSTKEGTYRYEYADNGVYVTFQFEKQEFEIPCFFGIEADRFVARVLGEKIVQHGPLRIANVSVLPFFGAGTREESGYMLVPDGSGAIIRFNNQKQIYQGYSQSMYGRNLTQNLQTNTQVTMDAMMPVFGIDKASGSMLGVITKGAGQSELRANVSGKITSVNNVYPMVYFIQSESNTLLSGSDNEEVAIMLSKQTKEFDYEVTYFLLEPEAGYAGMAQRYRQYLVEDTGMQAESAAVQKQINLDFIGGMKTRKTFLGVPYMAVEPLTTFSQMSQIALEVQQKSGNSVLVTMEDTLTGGSRSKMPTKISFASALGGSKGYKQMAQALEQAGIPFYSIYDTATLKSGGKGYSYLDAARNVSRSASQQYEYLLSSGVRKTGTPTIYLLTPSAAAEVTGKLVESAGKNGMTALGISGISNKMYGDYRADTVSPMETENYWVEALSNAAAKTDSLLLDGAFGYGLPFADVITNVPVYSSQFDVEDETVPFYQLVISGASELYGAPLNDCGNLREAFLKNVEYGVSPTFRLMAAPSATLQDTDYQRYFSLAYADWQDEILVMAEELSELDPGQRLVDHEKLGDNLYASTFADGSVVYVNYGSDAARVGKVTVPAMDFVREEAQQ